MSRRLFRKGKAPRALRKWLKDPAVTARWDAAPADVVEAMRSALAKEQSGLCCYCYGRLTGTPADHREHVVPQSAGHEPFDWNNLALSCEGGNQTRRPPHCDHAKGSRLLRVVHPISRPTVECARVRSDGKLRALDDDTEHDVVEVLHLDRDHLAAARRARIEATVRELGTTTRRKVRWSARRLTEALDELRRTPAQDLEPWTEQWLERQLEAR
ncbi:MAG: hypothetical protein H6719_31280 [Sandaracinaceae bacterium]|nr:hypothetical protein [Sandaracinaceae bacterium]